MKKLVIIGLLMISMSFLLIGCGTNKEVPAAGVSIENAEGQTLGFTYLYDLGNGYKLYADNFTKIVWLKYEYQDGKGATSIGSSCMSPYISSNGYYYKVNPQTRVIEELIPSTNLQQSVPREENMKSEIENPNSEKSEIEQILNDNQQKNENSNNQ